MTVLIYIGDEVTAAGFRLAGMRVLVPDEDALTDVFVSALEDAELLLIAAEFAARLPGDLLRTAMLRAEPLIVVMPDPAGITQVPDVCHEVDRVLGIAS